MFTFFQFFSSSSFLLLLSVVCCCMFGLFSFIMVVFPHFTHSFLCMLCTVFRSLHFDCNILSIYEGKDISLFRYTDVICSCTSFSPSVIALFYLLSLHLHTSHIIHSCVCVCVLDYNRKRCCSHVKLQQHICRCYSYILLFLMMFVHILTNGFISFPSPIAFAIPNFYTQN